MYYELYIIQLLHSAECNISFYGTEMTDIARGEAECNISHRGAIKTDIA